MTIKEKILTFLDSEGIKRADFFEAVGIVPSNFKGAAKQSELGGDKIAKILSLYPRLSAEWLMRGHGDMIVEDISDSEFKDKILTDIEPSRHHEEPFIDRLLGLIAERDTLIRTQAEDIGRLKECIAQLEREKNVSGVSYQSVSQRETVGSL